MFVAWGEDQTFIYNDAYIHVLSVSKHPWALGQPFREVWSEIWDICGPLAQKVVRISPPLTITESEAHTALALMNRLLAGIVPSAPTPRPAPAKTH